MCQAALLSLDDCKNILTNSVEKEAIQIHTYYFMPFKNPLQGLIGEHCTLKIEYTDEEKNENQKYFVKNINSNPLLHDFSLYLKVYEKESFFYNLLKEFGQYGIDTSFAPKGYFFKPYVVVLEDLSIEGYSGTPKKKFLDLQHCKAALTTIAKFHASSIAYEKKKSKELGQTFCFANNNMDLLEDKFLIDNSPGFKFLQSSVKALFYLIDLIPENHISHDTFKLKLIELLSTTNSDRYLISSIVHGDLWSSNFLYLYSNNKPSQCKLLDFQLIKYGSVELDVVEFLITNTSRNFRKDNFSNLIEYYYESLKKALIKNGLNFDEVFSGSLKEFISSCHNFQLSAKVHATIDHSYTFLSDEVYVEAIKTEDNFRRFIFEDRGKYVLESYNKNEDFRNVLTEDVVELRDLLFA